MRVLLVVHGFPPGAAGGTEIYTRALAHALAAQGEDVFVLARDANPCRPECSVRRGRDGPIHVTWINNTFSACTSFEDSYTNPALLHRAVAEVDRIAPDLVNVQHLTCLSTGIPVAASRRNIPVVMTLNDYWLICHRGQLLTPDGRRCNGPFDGGCDACLPAVAAAGSVATRAARRIGSLPLPGVDTLTRRALHLLDAAVPAEALRVRSLARLGHMREAVQDVELFLAPSRTLAAKFERFGVPPDRIRRWCQGIPLPAAVPARRPPSSTLRVGFAGALIPSKAPHVLLEAVQSLPAGSLEVDVLGEAAPYHGDRGYAQQLEPLLARPFVRRAGPVPHAQMPAALAGLDVLVVPSVWIENAPFVIREAFAVGTPVIASDLGGMAEMVHDGVDGLLFPPGDAGALAARLRRLVDEPGLLPHLRAGIRRPMSIDEDAAVLCELFRDVTARRRSPVMVRRAAPTGASASGVRAVVLNYRTPDQTWLAVRSLQTSGCAPESVIVVDNGSGDESARTLRERLRDVSLVETGRNLGFAGGCNVGIARALSQHADFVLLVNSDVVLHPDAIGQLCDAAAAHPVAGILAPLLLSREEPDRVASAGIRFAPATGRMVHKASGQHIGQFMAKGAVEVDAVSGCVMLVRSQVFDAIGAFDDAYFFSFEDIDLCLRARAAGFRVLCVDDAAAYHLGGYSIGRRSPRRLYFATRNHLRLAAERTVSPPPVAAARAGLIVGFNLAYALSSPDVPVLAGLAAVARGSWHHLIGRYGPA